MFEMEWIDYFELSNTLRTHSNMSLTEFNALAPWHLEIYLALIRREQEERKKELSNNNPENL